MVVEGEVARSNDPEGKVRTMCPLPECAKDFIFAANDTHVFDVPTSLFERRYFYRSEL